MDKCAIRKLDKIDKIIEEIVDLKLQMRTIETRFEHTIENKHEQAISIANAIDLKFKWISVILGSIGILGMIVSLTRTVFYFP